MKLTDLPKHVRDRCRITSAAPRPKLPRGMNKLEQAYARHMAILRAAGEIAWWAFQPWRLEIANAGGRRRFYTPDFVVLFAGGRVEFHETKGHMREAAQVRIAVAATKYPFRFVLVRRSEGGWVYTDCGEVTEQGRAEVDASSSEGVRGNPAQPAPSDHFRGAPKMIGETGGAK